TISRYFTLSQVLPLSLLVIYPILPAVVRVYVLITPGLNSTICASAVALANGNVACTPFHVCPSSLIINTIALLAYDEKIILPLSVYKPCPGLKYVPL